MKDDEKGRTCRTAYVILLRILKVRYQLEDLGITN
jgi:hypothetical protein